MSFIFTLAFAIPLTMLLAERSDWVIWTIWLGFLSHLFADMLNPSGVPLFWPLTGKRKCFHLLPKALRIPTKSPDPDPREVICRFGCQVATVALLGVYVAIPAGAHLLGAM
jgi:hypothetical protein